MSNLQRFMRMASFCTPYRWRIVAAGAASLVVGGLEGGLAYLVEPVLKHVFSGQDKSVFFLLPLMMVLIFVVRGLARFFNDYYTRSAGQLTVQAVRNAVYRRYLQLGMSFYTEHPTGSLMSRIVSDVNQMQDGISSTVTGLFRDCFSALALLAVVFYRDWRLALITFVFIPLTLLPAHAIGRRIKKMSKEGQSMMGDVAALLQETFSGIKVIKAFGLELREIERFEQANKAYYNCIRSNIMYEAVSSPLSEFIISLGIAAVIWVGGNSVMKGSLTPSEFFSFLAAMMLVYSPIKRLFAAYNIMQRSLGAADRVFEILDREPEVVDVAGARALERHQGTVEFSQVCFDYGKGPVLKNINFRASKGEVVAVVGGSGGGKSTLAALLIRLYRPLSGQILLDGQDIGLATLDSLLGQVALVDQDNTLFNDTIANNIRYGNPQADTEQIVAAAKHAMAHDFIMGLPDRYNTRIGDRGVCLSGGERQRLCIARAILKNAPVLILDEATSALDSESEQLVQAALSNLMRDRTTIVIAHRLSTIVKANRILVLEKGVLVENGSHRELMALNGAYRRLYELQSKADHD